MFKLLFSCCIRRRRRDDVIPDEESRLLQAADATSYASAVPNTSPINQQQIEERLGIIVRAKEGRMVNVNTPIPFNLHNKPVFEPSSASRSASDSARYPHDHASDCAPSNSSSSRSPSHSERLSHPITARPMDVRLVSSGRPVPPHRPRGRPRTRDGFPGDNADPGIGIEKSTMPTKEGDGLLGPRADACEPVAQTNDPDDLNDDTDTPLARSMAISSGSVTPRAMQIFTARTVQELESSVEENACDAAMNPAQSSFKIRNTGALALSWGD
ncbi:hypothetical protein FISHEDRAFT_59396 [Fistulina hepatica ATCC 64428]|uniref:Uncharacterized protein n=1 Tax=Fistulina hepatica ATCC 64428 TaxID=1128425 RepID=A0A0D7A9V5_9AGAR|nr:hypothetical protein FISHEDRAFT_59396 [Fistulina hepatica ATCC 64428]